MSAGNRARNRQTQPRAFAKILAGRIDAIKPVEQSPHVLRWNGIPGILDHKLRHPLIAVIHSNGDAATVRRVANGIG